jgi:hypothetical protein
MYIYRHGEEDVLHFPYGDQIWVRPEQMTYAHGGQHAVQRDLMDVRLLGSGFAWWLLRQGRVAFHAGAMLLDGEAALFTAESQTGKSTLMSSLLSQGVPLLCDDFSAVHLAADGTALLSSAYPQMRLWPPTVEQFLGDPAAHPPIVAGHSKRRVRVGAGWGRFLEGTYPVSRIYLLERRAHMESPVEVIPLSGHDAFMSLLTSITLSSLYPPAELASILPLIQQVAHQAAVYRLRFRSGWEWLPHVHDALLEPERFVGRVVSSQ